MSLQINTKTQLEACLKQIKRTNNSDTLKRESTYALSFIKTFPCFIMTLNQQVSSDYRLTIIKHGESLVKYYIALYGRSTTLFEIHGFVSSINPVFVSTKTFNKQSYSSGGILGANADKRLDDFMKEKLPFIIDEGLSKEDKDGIVHFFNTNGTLAYQSKRIFHEKIEEGRNMTIISFVVNGRNCLFIVLHLGGGQIVFINTPFC
jgi:hypothetical protein